MKEYFYLQFKMLNRKIIAFGVPLLMAYTIVPIIFFLLSEYFFEKVEFASLIYGFLAISFLSKLSDYNRNEFLLSILNRTKYHVIRIIENIIYCIPFTLFLIYKNEIIFALILNLVVISISFINLKTNLNITIPTPFSKKPFEFTIGFRKTFFVYPIAYFLTYISITIGNFNLGIFSFLLICLICFSYYSFIENDYVVWNSKLSSKEFLKEKIKTCLINFSLLSAPIIVALSFRFIHELDVIVLFFIICHTYLTAIVLAKYAAFPNEMNMTHGILFALSLIFPPILLFSIPHFYFQSIKKLNTVLE